jgi:RNA polymerase sigma-70 factor (ECF subfamily)
VLGFLLLILSPEERGRRNLSGAALSNPDGSTKTVESRNSGTARTEDPDRAEIEAFRGGDVKAFERLVIKYQDRIYNLAYRMVHRREEAEELSQEIFLKTYRQLAGFRGDSLFSTWLFQVAANHCKNRLKYLQRRKTQLHDSLDAPIETEDGQVERTIPDFSRVPEDEVARAQIQRLVSGQIATLPEDYRMVIVLRDIQGMSYEEIAQVLHTAEGTVKSRLHRARMELKERLKPYFDPSMIE